jgi:hypothetical protein
MKIFNRYCIITFFSGDRTRYRWNNIHTMAEAKAGLKSLLNWVRSLRSCMMFFSLIDTN